MSDSKYELQCVEVLTSFVILLDADVAEVQIDLQIDNMPQLTLANINSHLSGCVPCSMELVHERSMRDLTRDALRRSCNEEAPSDLHEALSAMFNQANFAGFKNEVIQCLGQISRIKNGKYKRHCQIKLLNSCSIILT